ncbi:bifunctional Brix domain/U3 snoRNP protein-Ribosome production factor 1 [Babesia duncani]|uniref:Bifunctional Brix domain/U3 snoRNP protein-Ribosome production factor 1 n=1 Tax=Babesia duncani TaxID=323732 RepID=A0AAD9PJY5_9APIC|nr:bifunctional Brix domain/U3 snoRNP protein-Ribosome production factor 1 [Babesia duncani]KAK2196237.1 bifunctional Brix domain/U3 snoRNP protein-Ribosome production factor 1 [Babesia duncani]
MKRKAFSASKGPKQEPKTIESARRPDDSLITEVDAELEAEEACDEFAELYNSSVEPRIAITTCRRPCEKVRTFVKELLIMLPNSVYMAVSLLGGLCMQRDEHLLKNIAKTNFTAILLITQGTDKRPNGLYICSLPYGPTSFYRITNLKFAFEMQGGAVALEAPEVVLSNFCTKMGRRVARQLGSIFPQPNSKFQTARDVHAPRRVICFHNQRDCIFFRHHRFAFKNSRRCLLHEIGPKFTLKLTSMQKGALDLKHGLYEYVWRADAHVDRKRFFL